MAFKRHVAPYVHTPGCRCATCFRSRTRKAKAEPQSAGEGGAALVPEKDRLNADLPVFHITGGRTPRDRIAQWIELRLLQPDITTKEAADKMGIAPRTLSALINRATKEGWLVFDDPISKIDHEIVPKVLDNLNHFLDAKDRVVTIEAAKGTVFKTYQEAKGIVDQPTTVLALKIEPAEGSNVRVISGQIVGKPKELSNGQD